jgi:serine/threonine protein kinase
MTQIGKYQIVEKLDSGGMTTIYRGIQTSLNRTVAIKVLSKKISQAS